MVSSDTRELCQAALHSSGLYILMSVNETTDVLFLGETSAMDG
jgi:hypothetical protein